MLLTPTSLLVHARVFGQDSRVVQLELSSIQSSIQMSSYPKQQAPSCWRGRVKRPLVGCMICQHTSTVWACNELDTRGQLLLSIDVIKILPSQWMRTKIPSQVVGDALVPTRSYPEKLSIVLRCCLSLQAKVLGSGLEEVLDCAPTDQCLLQEELHGMNTNRIATIDGLERCCCHSLRFVLPRVYMCAGVYHLWIKIHPTQL
jgi:hypothetical protein